MPDLPVSGYDEAKYSAVAKAALLELTPENTIGELTGHVDEDGAVTVTFAARMSGYPGWHWTVSVAQVDGSEPTALEVELMPGNGALVAPDWVPWSERLAEYQAAQEVLGASSGDESHDETESDDDDDDPDDDETDDDDDSGDDDEDDDFEPEDLLGSDVLQGGDLDGVDIDEPDEPDADDADHAEESDDDESDESDDDEELDRTY